MRHPMMGRLSNEAPDDGKTIEINRLMGVTRRAPETVVMNYDAISYNFIKLALNSAQRKDNFR